MTYIIYSIFPINLYTWGVFFVVAIMQLRDTQIATVLMRVCTQLFMITQTKVQQVT